MINFNLFSSLFGKRKTYAPYRATESLLTKAELKFYHSLNKYCQANDLTLFIKVRLCDIIVTTATGDDYYTYFNKINRKHLDYVLCDEGCAVLACVELNDRSHLRDDRIERDEFVQQALENAGIPIVFFTAQWSYNDNEITRTLDKAIYG